MHSTIQPSYSLKQLTQHHNTRIIVSRFDSRELNGRYCNTIDSNSCELDDLCSPNRHSPRNECCCASASVRVDHILTHESKNHKVKTLFRFATTFRTKQNRGGANEKTASWLRE